MNPSNSRSVSPSTGESRTVQALALAALLTTTIFCCLPAIDAPFTFDERAGIAENRAVHAGTPWREAATYRFSPDQMRPAFFLSLRLDAALHATTPRGYRIANLILHLLCGLAFLALLRRTSLPDGAVWAGTAFVLLHPLQSESIIYIWGRSGLLSTLFIFLCLLSVPWRNPPAKPARGGWPGAGWRWGAALACLSIALAAKEEAVAAPLFAFIWWRFAEARPLKGTAFRTAVLSCPVLLFVILRSALLGAVGRQVHARGVLDNILGESIVAFRYARLVLVPLGQSIDLLAAVPTPVTGLVALAALLAVTAAAAWAANRYMPDRVAPAPAAASDRIANPGLRLGLRCAAAGVLLAAAGSLLYFVAPLPDLMSERRFYLPLYGVGLSAAGLIATIGVTALARRLTRRVPAGVGPAIAVALILAPLLLARARVWSSPERLWEEARRLAPDKARPLINLGVLAAEAGHREEALSYLNRILELEPQNAEALFNRGRLRLDLGDARSAAQDLEAATQSDPTVPRTWVTLGSARIRLGDLPGAEGALRHALAIDPGEPRALTNLAEVLRAAGRVDEAMPLYRRALDSDPGYAHAAARLGVALEDRGDLRGALAAYREYLDRTDGEETAERAAVREKLRALDPASDARHEAR